MLGKFAHEVASALTAEDIANWIAYDNVKAERIKKARKKNKKGKK